MNDQMEYLAVRMSFALNFETFFAALVESFILSKNLLRLGSPSTDVSKIVVDLLIDPPSMRRGSLLV